MQCSSILRKKVSRNTMQKGVASTGACTLPEISRKKLSRYSKNSEIRESFLSQKFVGTDVHIISLQLRMSYLFESHSAFCPKVHVHACTYIYENVIECCMQVYDSRSIWHACVCVCVGVWLPGWEACRTWKRRMFVFAMTSLFVHLKAIIFKGKLFNLYTIVYVHTRVD